MSPYQSNLSRKIAAGLAIALACFSQSAPAIAQLLIVPETQGRSLLVAPPDHATEIELCDVDLERISAISTDERFKIQLYETPLTAIVEAVKPQVDGMTITGRFEKLPHSMFAISVVNDAVAGTFFVPGSRGLIRLRYGGPGGLHYLHKVDGRKVRTCAESVIERFQRRPDFVERSRRLKREIANGQAGGSSDPEGGCFPTATTFDVLIVYSDDARAAAGGTSAIRAEAINAVAITECTYLTCALVIRTNIVGLTEVAYNESGSYEDHLNRLTDPDDGILDGVHTLRDEVEADFVSLFVDDDESGGLGWCLADEDQAFSIVRWIQATDVYTLAHEMGHNIGCAHNPEDADCEPTSFGYGHNFFVPNEGVMKRTVMAYDLNDEDRIPYYSSPMCEYQGVFTGTADRDNWSVIFLRQNDIEAFRRTRMDVWVDFSYVGPQNGSYLQPYFTLISGVNRTLPDPVVDLPVLRIKAGSRNEAITIDKPMLIEACGGTVTIGQ